jgi:hypothetical protein
MRVESVDEVEIIRRMSEGIYDEAEYQKALAWTKAKCKEGFDKNPDFVKKSDEQKEKDWEFVVKMMCIIKDLMNGNENLPEGCEEEMVGHNAIAAGFQGQRQWTDFYPNCDFAEALLNTSFDWEGVREPYILATENDVLNGIGMLFMKLLTNRPQMFADVRTHWSADAVKRVTGYDIEGKAKEAGGFIHLINSGACCLDACGEVKDENGNPVMKPWYDVTEEDIRKIDDKVNPKELMINLYNTYLEFVERLNKNNKDFEGILIGFIKEFYINKVKVYRLKKHKEITRDIELVNYSILEFDKKKLKFRINITCFNYKTSKDEIIGGSNLEKVEQIFLITYVKFRRKWLINNIEKVFEKKQSM